MSPTLVALGLVLVATVALAAPRNESSAVPRVQMEEDVWDHEQYFTLPEGFLFGAGTSALQVEGAWQTDGRGESVIEYLLHNVSTTTEFGDTKPPDVAANSYAMYQEDVKKAKELKLDVYRFSVSWPRIFPDGDVTRPNKKGVEYYDNLVNALIEAGIKPMMTMHHFDLPLEVLRKTGGWMRPEIVDAFEAYADFLFEKFADRVKLWITVNEPNYYCMTFGLFAIPGLYEPQVGDDYKCVHHTVLAHMRAYRLFERKYKKQYADVRIGAAALTLWCLPNSTRYEDIQAAERANLFSLGSIYHPVVYGDYPPALRERVDRYSRAEGRNQSRLPSFTEEEKALLPGSADFLCFNAYMGTIMADGTHQPRPAGGGTIQSDRDALEIGSTTLPGHFKDLFMKANPWVLREAPMWIRDTYKNMPIFITENGWGDETGGDPMEDDPRVGYHSEYLYELVRVAKEEKVNVMGYIVWSLIDTYEWSSGFTRKFGLVHVDYENGSLKRTLKKSAWFFQQIGTNRTVAKVQFQLKNGAGSLFTGVPISSILVLIFAVLHTIRQP